MHPPLDPVDRGFAARPGDLRDTHAARGRRRKDDSVMAVSMDLQNGRSGQPVALIADRTRTVPVGPAAEL
jgi:hypothetical protein